MTLRTYTVRRDLWNDGYEDKSAERRRGHRCQTPGAIFHIKITPMCIGVDVDLPKDNPINISEEEAIVLTDQVHDAMEAVLARFFVEKLKAE